VPGGAKPAPLRLKNILLPVSARVDESCHYRLMFDALTGLRQRFGGALLFDRATAALDDARHRLPEFAVTAAVGAVLSCTKITGVWKPRHFTDLSFTKMNFSLFALHARR
jgi:hypothetical protein